MKNNLIKDINEVLELYPKLRSYEEADGTHSLIGEIDIFDASEIYHGSFDIRVKSTKDYPYSFPDLYETKGMIAYEEDMHMYKDGRCCVAIMQEEEIRAKKGITLKEFLKEFTIPFFANQLYYKNCNSWANGDYKHGLEGILQYYQELLNEVSLEKVISELNNVLVVNQKGFEKCFCGSGKKYKKCHRNTHLELKKLPKNRVKLDYELIVKFKELLTVK